MKNKGLFCRSLYIIALNGLLFLSKWAVLGPLNFIQLYGLLVIVTDKSQAGILVKPKALRLTSHLTYAGVGDPPAVRIVELRRDFHSRRRKAIVNISGHELRLNTTQQSSVKTDWNPKLLNYLKTVHYLSNGVSSFRFPCKRHKKLLYSAKLFKYYTWITND